ncbi:apolipoprotein N-acyltransferase [Cellulomonas shaoxiangyii]|uniref:Apolipoprotein N-acyltransferase n=1 Tax=Cellulomonas shaoxiangyii TaxID=2566013 RepID=A0A4P7SM00_9CELL|nr:apolipoprotein N-acyltransferase [Cellulomonas shaoxiangyii]QCB93603.1 apolipoprotein N-acyltransferase [Cellulomonas shaoxiangyii]TGY85693.1 apolipoprotein N-acyltransferase [Cellulomonas shaoxiangyii]
MPLPPPARWATLLLAGAGGWLTRMAFPDPGWWGAAYLGMALLYLALRRDSARWNALVGLVWGLACFAPMITWAHEAVGVVPWAALSLLEAAYVALFGAAWAWARRGHAVWRSSAWQLVVFVILWVGVEELRGAWPFGGFPWGRLAFSQADSPLASYMWLGGTPLLTAVVAAIGVLLARAVLAAGRLAVGRTLGALAGAVAVGLVALLVPLDTGAEAGTLRTGAVQGNVPEPGRLDAFGQRRQVLDNHVAGTRALLEQVEPGELDVVLWPENGSDIDPQVDAEAAGLIDGVAREVGAPMLVGTVEYPDEGGRFNTAVLWQPGTGVVATYSKQRPAPFAEYIPMRGFVRNFSPAVDLVTRDMVAGTEPGVVPLVSERLGRTVTLGDVICFEVAYDGIVRAAVREGGEVLVVQTNNASFGWTDESTQQLAMSRLRAIEHGRATVQISTVGVSAVIAPNGAVTQRTELFTPAQMVASLPLRTSLTPATRMGDWPARIAAALAVCVVVAGAVGASRLRRDERPDGA